MLNFVKYSVYQPVDDACPRLVEKILVYIVQLLEQ
jgi:hypothetical protein